MMIPSAVDRSIAAATAAATVPMPPPLATAAAAASATAELHAAFPPAHRFLSSSSSSHPGTVHHHAHLAASSPAVAAAVHPASSVSDNRRAIELNNMGVSAFESGNVLQAMKLFSQATRLAKHNPVSATRTASDTAAAAAAKTKQRRHRNNAFLGPDSVNSQPFPAATTQRHRPTARPVPSSSPSAARRNNASRRSVSSRSAKRSQDSTPVFRYRWVPCRSDCSHDQSAVEAFFDQQIQGLRTAQQPDDTAAAAAAVHPSPAPKAHATAQPGVHFAAAQLRAADQAVSLAMPLSHTQHQHQLYQQHRPQVSAGRKRPIEDSTMDSSMLSSSSSSSSTSSSAFTAAPMSHDAFEARKRQRFSVVSPSPSVSVSFAGLPQATVATPKTHLSTMEQIINTQVQLQTQIRLMQLQMQMHARQQNTQHAQVQVQVQTQHRAMQSPFATLQHQTPVVPPSQTPPSSSMVCQPVSAPSSSQAVDPSVDQTSSGCRNSTSSQLEFLIVRGLKILIPTKEEAIANSVDGSDPVEACCPCKFAWSIWINLSLSLTVLGMHFGRSPYGRRMLLLKSHSILELIEQRIRNDPKPTTKEWYLLLLILSNTMCCISRELSMTKHAAHHLNRMIDLLTKARGVCNAKMLRPFLLNAKILSCMWTATAA